MGGIVEHFESSKIANKKQRNLKGYHATDCV
jgi:hypothetical protein